jgi:hypothetical protein
MKTKLTAPILMLLCSMTIFAQHPLIGTWEMVSIKGTGADGKPVDWTTANMRETKIITPTHFILIQHIVRNDSVIFNLASAGTVRIEGNKYTETPTVTSNASLGNSGIEFNWNVKGDQFIQSGTIPLADGKKIVLDELVFKKVKGSSANSKHPLVGTWNQLSSDHTLFDGTKGSHKSPAVTRFDVFTPTHWIRIGHRDNKFENAFGGSYTIQKDKMIPTISVASFTIDNRVKYEMSHRFEGNKMYVVGTATQSDGKKMTWSDVYERVSGK